MSGRNGISLLAIALSFSLYGIANSYAGEKALTAQEVIAAHIQSIGAPDSLRSIKNRGINGITTVQFIQGGTPGKMIGQSLIVSAGQNLGIIMNYGAREYPGEHFAFDGTDVTVLNINPGQRSPLGDFVYRYNALMKEGLLGGALSLGWPLLDIEKRQPALKCRKAKVEGQELYEIEYAPKSSMDDVKVKLFFEPDTFRHVRTEYRLVVHGEQSLLNNTPYTWGTPKTKQAWNLNQRYSDSADTQGYIVGINILDEVRDSIYVLVEKFDKFKEIDFKASKANTANTLVLPQNYSIELSIEGHGSTFLGLWDTQATQWIQNGKIDSSFFKVQ